MEWVNENYVLTDEKGRLDLDAVCRLLGGTYWAADRPREVQARAMEHSCCLGLFHQGRQVGFARAVTDHATFTWICDVVVAREHRGRGLGRWMVKTLLDHPELQTPTHALRTRDAQAFYESMGFERVEYLRRSTHPR